MFQIFPEQADDLLDVGSLPPTDKTELNYRTRPLSANQEHRLTLFVLFVPLPIIVVLSVLYRSATLLLGWLDSVTFVFGVALVLWLGLRSLTRATMRRDLIVTLFYCVAVSGGVLWSWAERADVWAWRLGLIVALVTSSLIARQVAAWILAGPTVDHETMRRWRFNLPRVIPHGLSLDCPELLTFSVSSFLIGPAWLLAAWLAIELLGGIWYWPLFLVGSLSLIWSLWHLLAFVFVPWPSFRGSLRQTWQALVLFVTYDIYHTPAAGVFRFPTRWLRRPTHRWALLVGALVVIAFSYGTCCPDPIETHHRGGSFAGQLIVNLAMITAAGPLVLFAILWFTAGTLLARFDSELSTHRDKDTTDWDNYIDRIINSGDELERDHLFVGTSESGDYPIMIHKDIHDMHGHLLGDTGASKTSLGIAPQATQLIARADSTVVIVDLKGDQALFESCRREAARTRTMRFRWLSNEVGKSTFGFNPCLQSHNRSLSVEQLSQQLLQGLSLDYGIQYGAGYFTAMNEIVLNNVLKETGARSFRELGKHLSDRHWYKSIGHAEDWAQARHLGALVSRLAATEAINVVPEMYPEQPDVHKDAIDVTNLFAEPQVVYLSLRSAVEPTNAPTIARLFLWAMFTAASHQPTGKNRVYFFVDEIQQVISDGIKLIFEQFRDLGGTIIAAHQTAGQLRRQGTDLADTIDSCTAVKQVFRASDLRSIERLEKLSGTRREKTSLWFQRYERGTGDLIDRYDPVYAVDGQVRVSEQERARLEYNEILAIGSRRRSSLIRFTFGSGYTQFAGATIPMISEYPISFAEYERRRNLAWPTAPGAFTISPPAAEPRRETNGSGETDLSKEPIEKEARQTDFSEEFSSRGTSVSSSV